MSDEIFRLVPNEHGQWDIYDNEESKRLTEEKGYPCICIYNDLGNVNFSSAPQLCELLNELSTENRQLMQKNKELFIQFIVNTKEIFIHTLINIIIII